MHWIYTEGPVVMPDVMRRARWWQGFARVKSVANISASGHDVEMLYFLGYPALDDDYR